MKEAFIREFMYRSWLSLFHVLCSFSYEVGRAAYLEGKDRHAFDGATLDEPMCIIAWEAGYDDESNKSN